MSIEHRRSQRTLSKLIVLSRANAAKRREQSSDRVSKCWQVRLIRRLTCVALAFQILIGSPTLGAEPDASFYEGQTVRLIVGYGAGGGYDAYARLLAPHLERQLGATVVVENRPGGGGLVALNRVASGPADGLTIMLANGEGAALAQLVGKEGVRFNLKDLVLLVRVAGEPRIMLVSAAAPFKTLDDLRSAERPVRWAAADKTDGLADTAAFVSHALGMPAKIIIGYKGAKEAALSAIRGETDGIMTSASSARKFANGKELKPLAVLARAPSEVMADVPTIFELVELDEEQAYWIDYNAQFADLGRMLIAAPDTPARAVQELRRAVRAILTDPIVSAEAAERRRPLRYLEADQLRSIIDRLLLSVPKHRLDEIRTLVLETYY